MHNSTTHHLEPLRLLRPFVLAAAIGMIPAAAMAGGMTEFGGKAQSINQSGGQTQGSGGQTQGMGQSGTQQGMNQSGDQITLTQQEATQWEARPVVDQSGEKIGEVSSVSLDDQGKIEQLSVQMEQAMGLGGKTVTIEPSQFTASEQQVQLNMTNEQIKELPGAQKSQ